MKKLAYKWNMTPQTLSIFLTIIGLMLTTLFTIVGASWSMSSRFTTLEQDSRENIKQHKELSKKLDTLSVIAIKAFANSQLLEIKKQDKEFISPKDLIIGKAIPDTAPFFTNVYTHEITY